MIKCYACKKGIEESAKFCRFCGAVQICMHCKKRVAPGVQVQTIKKSDAEAIIGYLVSHIEKSEKSVEVFTCFKCGEKKLVASWKIERGKVRAAFRCDNEACGFSTDVRNIKIKDLRNWLLSRLSAAA